MKYQQTTAHGPEILDGNGVRFRLWAPSAQKVDLILDSSAPLPMEAHEDGWFKLIEPNAKVGSKYKFLINGTLSVPDPASRFQPDDITGASQIVDPRAFDWPDDHWKGRPWHEMVIYELHVGTYTQDGNYSALETKLDHLVELGVTAIELMPVAEFPGMRGWGYDGVLLYAPDYIYGSPNDLKHFVMEAHRRGLMIYLDVVYNHFGPSQNYLHNYAEDFFTDAHHTPWGAAINYENEKSVPVRQFFVDNAMYWLNEYRFDGLRFDAVHQIKDDSEKHFLFELAEEVRRAIPKDRHIHLILENEMNGARYLNRDENQQAVHYDAQWNDDVHHILHVLTTGQTDSYYEDFSQQPINRLGRALTQGFDYQGNSENCKGQKRGEKSDHLPPTAFISFMQNHDQAGNRALGERACHLMDETKLKLAMTIALINPQIPMLFMGEEWWASTPFLYFGDFDDDLAALVREGRKKEFFHTPQFADEKELAKIPDPNDEKTFNMSKLDWDEITIEYHQQHLTFTKKLLEFRKTHVTPLLAAGWSRSNYEILDQNILVCHWHFKNDQTLSMIANFSDHVYPEIGNTEKLIWDKEAEMIEPWHCIFSVRTNL